MIRIILAEDHNIVRDGLRSLIAGEPDLEVVAEAINGQEVVKLLEAGLPVDIILTDMNMPVLSGLELTRLIEEKYPHINTIVISALDNEKYVIQSFKAGAEGFVLKSVTTQELLFAIRHVFNGNYYICSELTTKFLNRVLTIPEPVDNQLIIDAPFSQKEVEVLTLLADGLTNQEIADKLFASKRTVEGYRESMISKTGVRNTAALIRFAMAHGVIN
ncbi:response regulator [Mucilaginibacter sp. HD30]